MKKNTFTALRICALVLAALACVLFATGCEGDPEDVPHTDPAFLEGTWSNMGATFTIEADLTFTCDLVTIVGPTDPDFPMPARVLGKLNYTAKGLGPNDYLMEDMTTAGVGEPDAAYTKGNMGIKDQVESFSGILVGTLTPVGSSQFAFTSVDPNAQGFFGSVGPYTKQP